MKHWNPRVEQTKKEQFILKRLQRTRRLFAFLRLHRHELFDDAFQDELDGMYRQPGAGADPIPPALLCSVFPASVRERYLVRRHHRGRELRRRRGCVRSAQGRRKSARSVGDAACHRLFTRQAPLWSGARYAASLARSDLRVLRKFHGSHAAGSAATSLRRSSSVARYSKAFSPWSSAVKMSVM